MSESIFGTQCLPVDDIFCRLNTWIWRILPVISIVVGTFGNITTVIVLLRKNLRTKPCFILVFVAVADVISLWSVGGDVLNFGYGIRLEDISVTLCLINIWTGLAFSSISFWVVAIFTIGRMMFVLVPHQTSFHLNRNKSIVLVIGVTFFVSILFWITFFTSEGSDATFGNQTRSLGPQNLTSCWNLSYDEDSTTWFLEAFGMVFCLFVPLLIILLGNCILIFKLYRRPSQSEADNSQIPFLFAISGVMLVTVLPYGVFYLVLQALHEQVDTSKPVFGLVHVIIENLAYTNHSLNFFCYLWKSSLFKTEFKTFLNEIKTIKISKKNKKIFA